MANTVKALSYKIRQLEIQELPNLAEQKMGERLISKFFTETFWRIVRFR